MWSAWQKFISRRKTYRSIEQKVTTTDSVDKTILSPIVCSIVDLREFHSCKREHIPRLYMQVCTALSFRYVRDSGYALAEGKSCGLNYYKPVWFHSNLTCWREYGLGMRPASFSCCLGMRLGMRPAE